MIDIIKQTPSEYSAQSRDYQVLARLYTALYNYVKMYIDNLSVWDTNIDNKLINLRARTLNFITDHSWDNEADSLEAITTCFKYLMRRKGTITALEYCINILMRIENISSEALDQIILFNNYNVTIRVPENILTLGVIEDLVKYLLPAGLTYNIIKYKVYNADDLPTELYHRLDMAFPVEGNIVDEEGNLTFYHGNDAKMFVGNNTKNIAKGITPNEITDTYIYTDSEGRKINEES